MKKKFGIVTIAILAILSVSLLFVVACKKENEVPLAPTGVSASITYLEDCYSIFDNSFIGTIAVITISWNEVSNADYYSIYQADNSSGPYEKITEAYITSKDIVINNSYEHNIGEEIDYYFKVKAKKYPDVSSPMSDYVYCHYSNIESGNGGGTSSAPSAPTGVSAEVSGSRVCVTWNSVSNASKYRVYRSSSSGGTYSMLDYTTNTYYYDSSPNTDNYYKVTSVNSNGDESEKSSYAYCYYSSGGGGGGGGGSAPSAPTGVSAEVSGSQIKVSWNSVSTATQYTVYRSTSASGSYTSIGTTSSTYYYDGNPSTYNYYKVKAKNSNGESSYSSYAYCYYSSGGGGGGGGSTNYEPCPPSVSASGTASSITVSWTKATGTGCGNPTSYKVYKRNPFTSEYEVKTTTSSTSYRDTDVHPGINRYAVEAINDYGSDAGYGYSSSIALSKPTSFKAVKSGQDYIKFTWNKVNQATGYQIFQSSTASGTYYIFDQVEDVSTLTKYFPGTSGTTYYFKIKAIWDTGGYGGYEMSDLSSWTSVTF